MNTDKKTVDVCVIVPTYNRAEYLGEALESILAQTCPPARIIVVDDGSTDDTQAVVARFGTKIQYVKKENGGKPSAVNLAVRKTQSAYLLIADDDDLLFPDAIEQVIAPLEADPDLGFSNGGLCYFRDDPELGQIETQRPSMTHAEKGHHFEALLMGYSMHLNATLVRRWCFDSLGGLDESFNRSEDYDFMLRLTRNYSGISVPHRVITLRRHDGDRGDAATRHSARERSLIHAQFDRRAFEKARKEAPLGSYIGNTDATLSPSEHAEAYLVRALTMARHGLWQECREDLLAITRVEGNPGVPTSRLELLSNVFGNTQAIEFGMQTAGYPRAMLKMFFANLGAPACRPIARGFYWAARTAKADGEYGMALRCLGYAISAFMLAGRWRIFRSPNAATVISPD